MAADPPEPAENDVAESAEAAPEPAENEGQETSSEGSRRSFLASTAMAGGLAAGYGVFFYTAVRFLFPTRDEQWGWQYLAPINQLKVGESLTYTSPSGASVVVTRQGESGGIEDFVALSQICPHLGCQVHWESKNDRFFCPCHNGAFDAQGNPTAGPVLKGKMKLTRFELRDDGNLLYIYAPLKSVRGPDDPGATGPTVGDSGQSPTHETGRA